MKLPRALFAALILIGFVCTARAVTIDRVDAWAFTLSQVDQTQPVSIFNIPERFTLSDGTVWLPGFSLTAYGTAQYTGADSANGKLFINFTPPLTVEDTFEYPILYHLDYGMMPVNEDPRQIGAAFDVEYHAPITFVAEAGSSVATWDGLATLLPAKLVPFYPEPQGVVLPSTPFGSEVRVHSVLENLSGAWTEDTFSSYFEYRISGYIDFTTRTPPPPITPVPEASTYAAAALALLAVAVMLRQRPSVRIKPAL